MVKPELELDFGAGPLYFQPFVWSRGGLPERVWRNTWTGSGRGFRVIPILSFNCPIANLDPSLGEDAQRCEVPFVEHSWEGVGLGSTSSLNLGLRPNAAHLHHEPQLLCSPRHDLTCFLQTRTST